MADAFDPYHKWLGISPKDQPPNHYRLLAIELFESDADVIEGAADQRMAHVRTFQTGRNSALSQRMLNELSAAKLCLLDPQKKAEYDRALKAKSQGPAPAIGGQAGQAPRPLPVPTAPPLIDAPAAPISVARSRTAPRKPAWQQPAILAGVGAAVWLMGAAAYFLAAGSKPVVQPNRSETAARPAKPVVPSPRKQPEPLANGTVSPAKTRLSPEPPQPSPVHAAADSETLAAKPAFSAARMGKAIDVLKQIDPKRDAVAGDWKLTDGVLVTPEDPFSRLMLPAPPSPEYQLTVVVERQKGDWGLGVGLVVDGRQVVACVDCFDGRNSGLELVDGKACNDNESTVKGRMLTDGRPSTLAYTVRRNGVKVSIDGRTLIDWRGDPKRLSMIEEWKVPDASRLSLNTFKTVCRTSKIELTPLSDTPSSQPAPPAGLLKLFEDEPQFIAALTAGDGAIELVRDEVYSGRAAIKVSGRQRYIEHLPGVEVKIRKEPKAPDEYRYLQFAWKKRGGEQIFLQLFYPSNWLRHSAGPYQGESLGPSIRVANELPSAWTLVTRDLASDFGEFTTSGIALSPLDGECGRFDHIYLARTLEDFDFIRKTQPESPQANSRRSDRARNLGDLVSEPRGRAPVPDEAAEKKARQGIQHTFGPELAGAKTPAEKRKLGQRLIEQAAKTADDATARYVLLRQASELGGAAGNADLAWQALDDLASEFAVDLLWLKQEALAAAGKAAKSPEQFQTLAERDCELLAASLAVGDAAATKKIALQAQGFAKRTKDPEIVKEIGSRTRDAGKLAAEFAEAAAARKTLDAAPDAAKANLIAGQWTVRTQGDWRRGLPMLAHGDDSAWKKAAANERALADGAPTPQASAATGDAWWSLAEKERWPARHYLRLHAAEWYRRALPSLEGAAREQPQMRLVELLASDDGLPVWEIFDARGAQAFDGFVRLPPGVGLRTPVSYSGPIEILLVARTDGFNIRLWSYDRESVIWNWEVNPNELRVAEPTGAPFGAPVARLEPNRWYSLLYRATRQGTTIFVDGAAIYRGSKVNDRFPGSVVGVNGGAGSTVDVKKFVVKPLE
ncbi:MAG TPA: hypothetical protein VMV10_14145 [Pirellulales bacterium]|nr:hypothetical protein [Pirellulales bacterium]